MPVFCHPEPSAHFQRSNTRPRTPFCCCRQVVAANATSPNFFGQGPFADPAAAGQVIVDGGEQQIARIQAVNVQFQHVSFRNGKVDGPGGAVHIEASARGAIFSLCAFSSNHALTGGAVAVEDGAEVEFWRTSFRSNQASDFDSSSSCGRAVCATAGTAVRLSAPRFLLRHLLCICSQPCLFSLGCGTRGHI